VSKVPPQPVAESRGNYEKMECSICYESINVSMRLKCQHTFCKPCLKNWYLKGENGESCPMCRDNMVCRKNAKLFRSWYDQRISAEKDDVLSEGLDFYAEEFSHQPEYLMHMIKKLHYIYSIASDAHEMEDMLGIWDFDESDSDSDSESITLDDDEYYDPCFFDTLDYDAMSEPSKIKRVYHNEPRTWELSLWYTQYPKLKNLVMN